MDAPYYNGEPGSRLHEVEMSVGERHDEPDTQTMTCRDCGATVQAGGSTTGIASGVSCQGCYRWRVLHGLVFDVRPRLEIEAAMRKGAA